jgi:hypothetical protein
MNHVKNCPECGSRVTAEQVVCHNCEYRFSSRDEDDEVWDEDDIVGMTGKTEADLDEEDFDDDDWNEDEDSGGVIMEDDPNAERESFDGEQEDDWDPPLYDADEEDLRDGEEGGEGGVNGRGDD